jgi:hypothetical protein
VEGVEILLVEDVLVQLVVEVQILELELLLLFLEDKEIKLLQIEHLLEVVFVISLLDIAL